MALSTIAGSSIGVTGLKFKKWHRTFWENLEISIRLHKIKKLIVHDKIKMKKIKVLFGLFIISASLSGQTRSFGEKIEEGSIIENSKIQNLPGLFSIKGGIF